MSVDVSLLAPSRLGERPSASTSRRPMYLSERRPKPDVRNLATRAGACAFIGEPTGHARMPPGLQIWRPSLVAGVPTPHLPAFTEGRAFLAGLEQLRNRRLNPPVHIRWQILRDSQWLFVRVLLPNLL